MMLRFALLALGLIATAAAQDAGWRIEPEPDWVVPLEAPPADGTAGEGEAVYLLLDRQTDARGAQTERYRRVVLQVLSGEGVEEHSRISIDFDPSYEELAIHRVDVRRGGAARSQLQPERIELLQREPELERRIYDGTRTAHLVFDDVRPGDVIESCWTVRGDNPTYAGRYLDDLALAAYFPVRRLRHRLLWNPARRLGMRAHGEPVEPRIADLDGAREFVWERERVVAIEPEGDLPPGFDPVPRVQLSEFESWAELARFEVEVFDRAAARRRTGILQAGHSPRTSPGANSKAIRPPDPWEMSRDRTPGRTVVGSDHDRPRATTRRPCTHRPDRRRRGGRCLRPRFLGEGPAGRAPGGRMGHGARPSAPHEAG